MKWIDGRLDFGDKWYIQPWTEWKEWLNPRRYNWQNFTLVQAEFENDACMGQRSIELGLLGFRLRIQWATGVETENMREVRARLDDWLERNGLKDSPDSDAGKAGREA